MVIDTRDIESMATGMAAVVGAVAGPDGLLPAQHRTLQALSDAFGLGVDVDTLEALGPSQAALAIPGDHQRHQVVRAMVMLAFMEHPPSADRERSIGEYARALGVKDAALRVFHDDVKGHARRMMLDTYRTLPFAQWERDNVRVEGFAPVARSVLATFGRGSSPSLAARFQALESCPEGSLGRKLWEMYRDHHWPFPGEPYGVPEPTTVHDWVHVLAGYAPTPIGEIQVTSFIAASSDDDRLFGAVLLTLGLYEAGAFKLPQFPELPEGHALEQPHAPEALADSIRRGAAMEVDLMLGIDHWALADEQVSDLRERFSIPEKNEPAPTVDPGL